LTVSE